MRWYVVADSSRARFLHAVGKKRRTLEVVRELDSEESRTRPSERTDDRRGRVFDRQGPGRHAMAATTDPQALAKDRFAGAVAEALRVAADGGLYDELVLVAPPQALGRLRAAMPERLRGFVVSEYAKDLTALSEHELVPRLDELASV